MRRLAVVIVLMAISTGAAFANDDVVTRSTVDIYKNGLLADVSLIMTEGRKYDDSDAPWCGNGLKYEGYFAIVVAYPDGRKVATDLWACSENPKNRCKVFFYVKPWSIHFTDYNHDGVQDFNLWQYGSCNMSSYTLFTFRPDGKVAEIGYATVSGHDHSTDRIKLDDRGYSDSAYNNAIGGPTETFYEWDKESQMFVPYRRIDCHDCLGSHRIRQVESIFNKTIDDFEPIKETESVYNPETGETKVIRERAFSP